MCTCWKVSRHWCDLELPSRKAQDLQVSTPAGVHELQRVTSFLGQSTQCLIKAGT